MRIITYLFLLILIVLGFTFACLNAESVTINYYVGQVDAPLSLLLGLVLFIGGLFGILSALGFLLKLKKDNYVLAHKLKQSEKECESLKAKTGLELHT